jgi:hypothetical protein
MGVILAFFQSVGKVPSIKQRFSKYVSGCERELAALRRKIVGKLSGARDL